MTLRVLFSTTAGSGHFGPLISLARALAMAGHQVAVTAPGSLESAVVAAGFEFLPRTDTPWSEMGAVFSRMSGLSFLEANLLYMREVFGRLSLRFGLADCRRIVDAWSPNVVVREAADIVSFVAATETAIPQIEVAIGLSSFNGVAYEQFAEPLAEIGIPNGVAALQKCKQFSAVPPSFDLASGRDDEVHRFRSEEPTTESDLPDWWHGSSDPLVYVTFGTEAGAMDLYPDFYRAVLGQLAGLRVRVLMTIGRAADAARLGELPANVHVENWWLQANILPQAAAVVGHGGYGTMLATFAAGLPSVAIPLFAYDQHHNAARLAEVGAGINLIGGPADVGQLSESVLSVIEDDRYRSVAVRLQAEMAALPLPSEAIRFIEDWAAVNPSRGNAVGGPHRTDQTG